MSDAERKYATVKHPTIEALVHGLYKYVERKDAVARLLTIRDHFVMSKEGTGGGKDHPYATFWIKGYSVTESDDKKGFTGQFCRMEIGTNARGQFTLTVSKVDVPLAKHPQKKRPPVAHPNWGHPVMRSIKKGKVYETLEEASAELELLHLEFPEASIPGINKLYLIVYEKREGVKQPTRKVALELEATDKGFIIRCQDNEKGAVKLPKPAIAAPDKTAGNTAAAPKLPHQKTDDKPVGGWSSHEMLRKKKRAMKRKRSDPRVSKKVADNPHES